MPGHTNFLQIRLALLSPQVMGYTISASKLSPSSAIFTSHRHMDREGQKHKISCDLSKALPTMQKALVVNLETHTKSRKTQVSQEGGVLISPSALQRDPQSRSNYSSVQEPQ